MAKKKKEKVIYYDDNSTIADMSNVTGMNKKTPTQQPKSSSTASEKWQTYWSAVRMMIVPMFIALGVLTILFVLLFALSGTLT